MKSFFDSTNWIGYTAVGVLVLISLAAVFMASRPAPPGARTLPPIQQVQISPGFVGTQPFGLWTLMCENLPAQAAVAQPAARRVCRTNARVVVRGPNNAPLLAAGLNIVMMDTQKSPGLLFRLPPAAQAADNINFAIDTNPMFKAPLHCSAKECLAQGVLPADAIEQMRQGRTLSVLYTIKDRQQKDRKVRVDQLLHGFRQSYDAMTRAMSA